MNQVVLHSEVKGVVALLKNFKSEALLPVFEAVINGIQAIEDKYGDNLSAGTISVRVKRSSQQEFSLDADNRKQLEISGFEIQDNGIGFTDDNLESFQTVASNYKAQKGGKGIGRFTWLKAFENATIESVYQNEECRKFKRKLSFSIERGLEVEKSIEVSSTIETGTIVGLNNFKKTYKNNPSACRTGEKIAQRIMEHCLFYFLATNHPKIELNDTSPNGDPLYFDLQNIYDGIKENIESETLELQKKTFSIYHMKLYDTHNDMHNLVLCANKRDVLTINMGKLLGTSNPFDSDDKRFIYAVYVSGEYLDEHVDASRTDFDLPDEALPLDADNPIGLEELQKAVAEKSKVFLQPFLDKVKVRREEIVTKYVAEKNPALRAVPTYCPEIYSEIEPNTQEEKLDEILYKYKGKAEYEIRRQSQKLLKTQYEDISEIREQIDDMVSKIDSFNKDNLAGYILLRKKIIELLDKKISLLPAGSTEKEEVIHDIFFPRKNTSDVINLDDHNLWLLDDRLTFHQYATSDLPLRKVVENGSDDRPDIMAFTEVDEGNLARSISVIEFKRPLREGYGRESPQEQIKRMISQIQNKNILTNKKGRPLRTDDSTRYYGYALCDFTTEIRNWATLDDFQLLPGELGYFIYNRNLRASIYIINYDSIVKDVKQRNFAFFEKLGITTFE